MKLKTLKDFYKEIWEKLKEATSPLEKEFLRGKLEQIDNDKQLAIKWVKDIRKRADEPENTGYNSSIMLSVQGWIMKFFNITEEDLK